MKFRRDSLTLHAPVAFDPDDLKNIGVNITQGGEVELRINGKVAGRLPIRAQLEGKPEARPTNPQSGRDVSN